MFVWFVPCFFVFTGIKVLPKFKIWFPSKTQTCKNVHQKFSWNNFRHTIPDGDLIPLGNSIFVSTKYC